MGEIADAAEAEKTGYAQTLFFTLDAHNLTHDIDRPLRAVDTGLARDICLSVVVLENQMAGTLDPEVMAREAASLAALLHQAQEVLSLPVVETPAVDRTEPCSGPIGSVTDQRLTPQRISDAATALRQMAEFSESGDVTAARAAFLGDTHNITHDIDGPLRGVDPQTAIDLCRLVLKMESQLGSAAPDSASIAIEATKAADLLEDGGRALGILE